MRSAAVLSRNHRGKRSQLAKERRDIRNYLITYAYIDQQRAEKIAMDSATFYTPVDLIKPYGQVFESVQAVHVEKGDVLVDSRGQGVLQKTQGVNK